MSFLYLHLSKFYLIIGLTWGCLLSIVILCISLRNTQLPFIFASKYILTSFTANPSSSQVFVDYFLDTLFNNFVFS